MSLPGKYVVGTLLLCATVSAACARSRAVGKRTPWTPDDTEDEPADISATGDEAGFARDSAGQAADSAVAQTDADADFDAGNPSDANVDARVTPDADLVDSSSANLPPDVGEICSSFLVLAKLGNEQLVERERWASNVRLGEPGANPPNTECGSCVLSGQCVPPSNQLGDCAALAGCVERHCLCRECLTGKLPTGDFCGCVATCIPDPGNKCWTAWLDHMRCTEDECNGACL